jgi:hypothetical protein
VSDDADAERRSAARRLRRGCGESGREHEMNETDGKETLKPVFVAHIPAILREKSGQTIAGQTVQYPTAGVGLRAFVSGDIACPRAYCLDWFS